MSVCAPPPTKATQIVSETELKNGCITFKPKHLLVIRAQMNVFFLHYFDTCSLDF